VIEETLSALDSVPVRTLEEVLEADARARMRAVKIVDRFGSHAA